MKTKLKSITFILILLCLCFFSNFVSAQKLSNSFHQKELNLKMQIYYGAEDEYKSSFELGKVFILKENPINLLKELKLASSFTDKKDVSDELYLQAASLILMETDKRNFEPDYLTGWNYNTKTEEIDEDISLLSFVISSKFRKNLVREIDFDNLIWSQSLKVPNEKLYLFGFCKAQDEIFIWNQTIKDDEIELDQYSAEVVFTEKEFRGLNNGY